MRRYHGGRVEQGILDFSSPSNPLGPPPIVEEAIVDYARRGLYTRYPDYEYRRLREAVASYYNLDPELVVPLNGSAEALQLILPVVKPKVVVSVEPTFGDHKLQAFSLGIPLLTIPYTSTGSRYVLDPSIYCSLPAGFRRSSLIITSNPNNPTGALTSRRVFEEILSCSGDDLILVVDEAFSDFTGNSESMLGLDVDNVIVVRSFTKIFCLQGLRVGFLYTSSRRLAKLLDNLRQPWNVNGVAVEVLLRILEWSELKDYLRKSLEVTEMERAFLAKGLSNLGLKVYESHAPFILVEHPIEHPEFNEMLVRRGVYVRDASTFTYLSPFHSRVSVRLRRDNEILLGVLKEVLGDKIPRKGY